MRTLEQSDLFKIWLIVLFFQIAAVVIFIFNFALDAFIKYRCERNIQPTGKKAIFLNKEEDNIKHSNKANNEPSLVVENSIENIPKVIKVLTHKIHGGRKKDSKFWSPENDLSERDVVNIPDNKFSEYSLLRNLKQPRDIYLYLSVSLVITTAVLVFVKPDLFPFLKYHNIYNSIKSTFSKNDTYTSVKIPSLPNIIESTKTNKSISIREKDTNSTERHLKPSLNPVSLGSSDASQDKNNYKYNEFSTKGRVFSWKDEDGKYHFSNTNFPLDNDSLQVQTEINTYHKATKINIIGDRIFVPVVIGNNGKEVKLNMLLDTGCNQTTISFGDLDKINPVYIGKVTSRIANGSEVHGKEATIDYIKVGSKRLNNVTVTGQGIAGSSNSGLLGLDFLKNASFKIDFINHFIIWM